MRRLGLALVGLGVAIQLVPVPRDDRTGTTVTLDAPPAIVAALRDACYDCHSQSTVWPWYSRIAPVSWLVAHDVAEGREHLDLSTWSGLRPARRAKLFGEIAEDVEKGEMPPVLYRLAHPEARLDEATRSAIVAWARASADSTRDGARAR
jgi:hypothetical protein